MIFYIQMDISLSNIVSTSEIQKNYRKIFEQAKKTKKPVVIMRGNKPVVAVIDMQTLEKLNRKVEEFELEDALRAIEEGERELKEGKTKTAKSLTDLL